MKKIILTALLVTVAFVISAQRDQKFAVDARMANLMEVKLGELAMTNGFSEEIKQLGQIMKEDHSRSNGDLIEITSKKGMPVPMELDEKHQLLYDKLSKKNAEDFDKAYAKRLVKEHKKNICRFKKEAKRGKDAELKQYASNTVPVLQQHLEKSKKACEQLKKK
jgi:putative membrane protein